jgi:hypothetical protein
LVKNKSNPSEKINKFFLRAGFFTINAIIITIMITTVGEMRKVRILDK